MLQQSVLKRERKLYRVLGAESSYIYAEGLYRLTLIELACSTKLLVHVTVLGVWLIGVRDKDLCINVYISICFKLDNEF